MTACGWRFSTSMLLIVSATVDFPTPTVPLRKMLSIIRRDSHSHCVERKQVRCRRPPFRRSDRDGADTTACDPHPATRDLRPAETFFYRNSARKRIPEPLENLTSRNWVSRAISTNAHDLCDRIEAAFAAFAKYTASSARSRAESDQFLFASPSNGGPAPKTRSVLREVSRSMHAQMPPPCL